MWDKTQLADFRISIHAPRMGSDYTSDQIVHCKFLFQSTLPGWGATERARPTCRVSLISIHAPRMGSDVARHVHRGTGRNFNPRSPDGERRCPTRSPWYWTKFQSTLPGWGATGASGKLQEAMFKFQSTLPGWGATEATMYPLDSTAFQSTLPGWGATAKMDIFAHDMGKIIHFQH